MRIVLPRVLLQQSSILIVYIECVSRSTVSVERSETFNELEQTLHASALDDEEFGYKKMGLRVGAMKKGFFAFEKSMRSQKFCWRGDMLKDCVLTHRGPLFGSFFHLIGTQELASAGSTLALDSIQAAATSLQVHKFHSDLFNILAMLNDDFSNYFTVSTHNKITTLFAGLATPNSANPEEPEKELSFLNSKSSFDEVLLGKYVPNQSLNVRPRQLSASKSTGAFTTICCSHLP
jgi:hypothetical protein